MRTLITGVTGFVGGHLAECLLAAGDSVYGLAQHTIWAPGLSHLSLHVPLRAADLNDCDAIQAVLIEFRPDRIAHLAGFADAGASFRDLNAAWNGNLNATRNLFDAVAKHCPSTRILFVSTGHVYGPATSANATLDESAELRPTSPYAASKAAADLLAYQVARHPGLAVVRVRPFNQVGPRQPPQYAAGHFARQLAKIEAGLVPPRLEVGDLSARRDLTDVRDMVAAFRLLLDVGRPGEVYNAGCGIAIRIGDMLDLLRAECRVPVEIVPRPERGRPADAGTIAANATKLMNETGWVPRSSLDVTLRDTLNSWRAAVATEFRAIRSIAS